MCRDILIDLSTMSSELLLLLYHNLSTILRNLFSKVVGKHELYKNWILFLSTLLSNTVFFFLITRLPEK